MTTRSELAAEYSSRQTGFQTALNRLREQTEYVRRARERRASDHDDARKVLDEMTQQVKDLRDARDRVWRQLKG